MRPIRMGYVGCGGLAQLVHLPNIMAAGNSCTLLGIAEVRPNLARLIADKWRIPRVYADHRALAADPDIDAVMISGHWSTQGDIAAELLLAGKDVLMEKPMAASLAQAERIVEAVRTSGRRLMVAYMKRYDAGNVLLKQTIDRCRSSGEMGQLRYVRNQAILGDWMAGLDNPILSTNEPYPAVHEHFPDWLPQNMRTTYFHYIQQYTHNINFLRWLLDAGPGAVTTKAVELDPNDGLSGVVVLRVAGMTTTLESGCMRWHEWNEKTSLFFERGMIESQMFTLLLRNQPSTVVVSAKGQEGHAASRTELFPADGRTWAYRNELEHFLACLRSGAPFHSSAEDALQDVAVLEDIYRKHVETHALQGVA